MGITVKVRITGARTTLLAFRALGKAAEDELRDANQRISEDLASRIRTAAVADGSQAALVGPLVKARRDRLPTVQVGGKTRVGSQSRRSSGQRPTTVSDLLYGSNFGAVKLTQFPRRAVPDHWFFTTVEDNDGRFEAAWLKATDDLLGRWAR